MVVWLWWSERDFKFKWFTKTVGTGQRSVATGCNHVFVVVVYVVLFLLLLLLFVDNASFEAL